MQELTFAIVIAGYCLLDFVGSEEYGVKTQGKNPQGTYQNQKTYSSPHSCRYHHHHNDDLSSEGFHSSRDGDPVGDTWHGRDNFHGSPQFPPGFQHSPEWHARHSGLDYEERSAKSDEVFSTKAENHKNTSIKEIPLEFFEKFDSLETNDILLNYVEGYEDHRIGVENRFGDDAGQERNAGVRPINAGCTLENTTVPFGNSSDPTIVYIPKCTKIEQCSGCCTHRLLECQAIEKEVVWYKVIKATYTGGKKLKYDAEELYPLERHTKCKCDCRIKAEHCLPHQEYRKKECGCACTNTDEERKCYRDVEKKEWDPTTCSCKCRRLQECSTGTVFDNNECVCKTIKNRRFAYNTEKIPSQN